MKKFETYFTRSLPLAGIGITCILVMLFIGYYQERSLLAWLYCFMPLGINLIVSIGYRIIRNYYL